MWGNIHRQSIDAVVCISNITGRTQNVLILVLILICTHTQKKIGALNVMKSAGSYVDIILEVYTEVYTINIHFYKLPLVGGVNT